MIKTPDRAGVLGFRVSIVREDSGIDLKKELPWKKKIKKRPDSSKVRCYVFQCKDLPAADDDGAADPMVLAYSSIEAKNEVEKEAKTVVMEKNCDPMFYEILELTIDAMPGEKFPPFIIDIYDQDKNTFSANTFDFMGRSLFFEDECSMAVIDEGEDNEEGFKPPDPKWHKIRVSPGADPSGEVLLSFVKFKEFDYTWAKKKEEIEMMGFDDTAIVKFDEFRVEMNVLGLRGLISPGLLPIQKAYIDFMISSLVPPIAQ